MQRNRTGYAFPEKWVARCHIVQLVLKAWRHAARNANDASLSEDIGPYMLYQPTTRQLVDITRRTTGYERKNQFEDFFAHPTTARNLVADAVLAQIDEGDLALRCITYILLERVHEIDGNGQFYVLSDKAIA